MMAIDLEKTKSNLLSQIAMLADISPNVAQETLTSAQKALKDKQTPYTFVVKAKNDTEDEVYSLPCTD